MSLPELIGLYKQFVTVEPYTGRDSYGQPTFGTGVSHRVRIAGNRRLFTNDKGEETLATHDIYFAGAPRITELDRFRLSTDFVHSTESGAINPTITALGRYPDDRGRICVVAHANLRYLGF